MKLNPKLKAKGDEGEAELNKWLQENNLCYVFLAQDAKTFGSLFPGAVKRPDFLVLIESVGLIAVDAKNYQLFADGTFSLGLEKELMCVLTFERLFRIPVWYAYRHKDGSTTTWYWISALKALEVGTRRENTTTKEEFLAIKLDQFSPIRSAADMGLLYTHRHTDLKKLRPAG